MIFHVFWTFPDSFRDIGSVCHMVEVLIARASSFFPDWLTKGPGVAWLLNAAKFNLSSATTAQYTLQKWGTSSFIYRQCKVFWVSLHRGAWKGGEQSAIVDCSGPLENSGWKLRMETEGENFRVKGTPNLLIIRIPLPMCCRCNLPFRAGPKTSKVQCRALPPLHPQASWGGGSDLLFLVILCWPWLKWERRGRCQSLTARCCM